MVKLKVTLPAVKKALRSRASFDINKDNEQKSKSSKERVRKFREKIKNDPKKLQELKEKKKAENKAYKLKLKQIRENNKKVDELYKEKQRKWQKDSRKRKLKQQTKSKVYVQRKSDKPSSLRKRAERVRASLPKDSETWAATMSHIIENATPKRASLLLSNESTNSSDHIAETLDINKMGRPKKNHEAVKKKLAFSEKGSELWETNKSLEQYKRRKTKQVKRLTKAQSFRAAWKSKLETFLETNSRVMPNKKDTVNIGGNPVAKRHLLGTKLELYKNFKNIHPDFNRKFTVFKEIIPKNYKKLDLTCRRVCICTKDYNYDQQVEALNKAAQQKMLPDLKVSPKILSDLTLCPYQEIPSRACINRQCASCGTYVIQVHYQPLLKVCEEAPISVKLYQWESKEEVFVTKKGEKKTQIRWIQVPKTTTVEDLVDSVTKTLKDHSSHLFRAMYQHKMEQMLADHLPIDHCLVVMDFSENISLQPQDEIESAHWTNKQVTLHPIFIQRHDINSTSENPIIRKESLVVISDSLTHNADTVYAFTSQLFAHLSQNPGPCPIKVIHRYSDNCATQYKSKYAFQHMQLNEQNFEVKVIYNYTKSGHGKGPSDGIGAAVKKKLERMILGGKVLNNAYQVYLALTQNKNENINQRIIYVPNKKIMDSMPKITQPVKCLPGTQSFHMVSKLPGRSDVYACNDLSCSCSVCVSTEHGPCYYGQYRESPIYYCLTTGKKVTCEELFPDVESINTNPFECNDVLCDNVVPNNDCPAYQNEEFHHFEDKIGSKGWKIRGQTPGDGNCFFWCLSDQLDLLGISQQTHTELRNRVVQHMKTIPQSEQLELEQFLTSDFASYIAQMAKNGTYADHVCLLNTCKMLSCNLQIVHAETPDINLGAGIGHPTFVLGYLPGIQHYVSLEPTLRYSVDDYVSVQLLGTRSNKSIYTGQIIEIDTSTQEFKVSYMKKAPLHKQSLYFWPDTKDESWEHLSSITGKLGEPVVSSKSTNRQVLFEFVTK